MDTVKGKLLKEIIYSESKKVVGKDEENENKIEIDMSENVKFVDGKNPQS